MGCYESFTAKVKCICGHEFEDDNIQSKDFECMLDHLKQGEDTRELKERHFLYKDSIFEKDFTVDKAIELCLKHPKKYTMNISHYKGGTIVSVYHWLGLGKSAFFGNKDREFNCYTTCPKCKKWLELIGTIKDYVFEGVRVDGTVTK